MKTFWILLLLLAVSICFTCPLLADQVWTAEQKEVLDFEQRIWSLNKPEQMQEQLAVFHPSYVGWSYERPIPCPLHRQWLDYYSKISETTVWEITPLAIQVYGNFAFIHYYYRIMVHDKIKNEDNQENGRWTDILIKENGKWLIVGAHGGATPTK